jgi:hypothetical protein
MDSKVYLGPSFMIGNSDDWFQTELINGFLKSVNSCLLGRKINSLS